MIKFSTILIFILILIGILPVSTYGNYDKYFIVTAYYSPLPGQKYYLKGNYEKEKRLNGEGIRGASGKGVFSGMLAAPKNYRFGTKIYLQGLGIGSVEDRGGAIVNAGNRGYNSDRIDVWMGYGDEGLRRALYWGKRKVKGHILPRNSKVNLNYNNISSPLWVTKKMRPVIKKEDSIFKKSIGKNSNIKIIKNLQLFLKDIGLYNGEIDGVYNDEVIDVIFTFQKKNNILSSQYDYGAGYFGPKTRLSFKKYYDNIKKDRQRREDLIIKYKTLEKQAKKQAKKEVLSIGKPKFGEISIRVRGLQKLLASIGYFNYKDTAIFGEKTRKSLIKFQLENEIISSEKSKGAGIFGPKTLSVIEKQLSNKLLKMKIKDNNLDENKLMEIGVYKI